MLTGTDSSLRGQAAQLLIQCAVQGLHPRRAPARGGVEGGFIGVLGVEGAVVVAGDAAAAVGVEPVPVQLEPEAPGDVGPASEQLVERETDVLRAYCAGASMPRVAKKLHLSEATVKRYLERARDRYDKVGRPARTKALLTLRVIEDEILTQDEVGLPDDDGDR